MSKESDNPSPKPKRRFPLKTLLFTIIVLGSVAAIRFNAEWLSETVNLPFDEVNVITIAATFVVLLTWGFWWTFLSGIKVTHRVIGLLLVGGLLFGASRTVKIVPGGDLDFRRIEFSFWPRELEIEDVQSVVDMKTRTPEDFPQFRGPERSGVVSTVILAEWADNLPELMWKRPIGKAWSGFVVVNGFAVTMEQSGKFECVTCYDVRNGDLKWVHKTEVRHEDIMGLGGAGPRATPTIDGGMVYVMGATGLLKCLDGADGSMVWSVDLTDLLEIGKTVDTDIGGYEYAYEKNSLAWGRSGSPLIYGDKVIVTGGGPTGGPFVSLIAFDKLTGDEIWRGGDKMIAYGSPSVATFLGQDQIVTVGESITSGHNPETGAMVWEYLRQGASDGAANCSQVTPVSDNEVLLTKGYRSGGELVQFSKEGDDWKLKRVWKNNRVLKTKINSPVIRNGFAYSLSAGYLECTEVATGKLQWIRPDRKSKNNEDRFGHGQFLLAGNRLLVISEHGELFLIAAEPEDYRRLGKVKAIDGICWNNLCLYGNLLIVRSDIEAACFRLPTADQISDHSLDNDFPENGFEPGEQQEEVGGDE